MKKIIEIALFIAKKIIRSIPTILFIVILNFFLMRLAPGDLADMLAAEAGDASAELMEMYRERFGLNLPILVQLVSYLSHLANFDLGFSFRYNVPVVKLIADRLPNTLLLMFSALAIALVTGIVAGSVMAFYNKRAPDRVLSVVSLLFYSLPNFWIGLMLIVQFSVILGWLPSGGSGAIGRDLTGFAYVADKARYLALPAVSLGLTYAAFYARFTRASVIEARSQDYVRTARAKGLTAPRINIHHVLRNALIPVTTMAGMHIGGFIGGAIVIETVFSWPGLGGLVYEAALSRDLTLLLGILLLSSILVIATNIVVDSLYRIIDPRIK